MNNDKNLENGFKSMFDFDEIEQQDWNAPSEQVWVNIEDDLKKKNLRILMYSWISTFGIFLFCAAIYFYSSQKPTNLLSQLTKTTSEVQLQNKSFETSQSQVANQNNIITVAENKVVNNLNSITYENNKNIFENKKSSNKNIGSSKLTTLATNNVFKNQAINKNLVDNELNINGIIPIIVSSDKKEETKVNTTDVINIFESKSPSTLLEALPLVAISMLQINKTVTNEIQNLHLLTPIKVSKSLPIVVSLVANNFKLQNNIKGSVSNFDGEKLNNAFSFGINIAKPLRNSFIEIGAAYSQLNYTLNYDIALPFNGKGETQNKNGNFDNTYNGSVPTSFGNLNMQMVLARQQGHSIVQGEAIPLTAKGSERLSFINIPISWGKSIRLAPKFYATGKMTFSNNILLKASTQFEEVVSHHDAVLETLTVVKTSPKPTIWTPFLGASVGLNYNINSRLGIGATTFLQQSLQPMFKNEQYRNSPSIFGGGINLEYRF